MPASRPSLFRGGGGILRDVDSTIIDIQFTTENPLFTGPKPPPKKGKEVFNALYAVLELLQDGADKSTLQPLFVGSADAFSINEDGRGVTDAIENAQISKNSDFSIFMGSLIAAGFDEDLLDNTDTPETADYSPLIGARIRTNWQENVEKTKRLGKKKSKDGKKEYSREDLIVTNFYEIVEVDAAPTSAAKGKTTAAKAVATKPGAAKAAPAVKGKKAPAEPEFDVAEETTAAILTALAGAKDKTLSKNQLSVKLLNAFGKHTADQRAEVRTLAIDDEYLSGIDGVTFDAAKKTLTLDE